MPLNIDRSPHRRGLIIIIAVYLVANALILALVNPDVKLTQAADGGSWQTPALALLAHGGFVDLDDPSRPDTYRPPMYPLFQAGVMMVAGVDAIVVAQILLLLFVGLMFRNFVRDWLPGWENIGMALLVFNPNVLSKAHFVQSEILFLTFVTLAFWATAKYVKTGGSWRYALGAGLGVALACLTRPTAQFLLFALPVLFPLLAAVSGRFVAYRIAFLHGAGTFACALIVIAPWVAFVASLGHGVALSDSAGKYRYVWDQVVMIDAQSKGLSYHETESRLTAPGGAEHDFIADQGEAWNRMNVPERNRALIEVGIKKLLSYPLADFAKALYRSQMQFYFAGGAGNWHNLFNIDAGKVEKAWFSGAQDDGWNLLVRLFSGLSPLGATFSVIAIGFVVVARIVGVVGLATLAARGRWDLLMMLCGVIAYFAFVHVFVGNSRYRIAVEPMLMFLMLSGFDGLRRWTKRS